MKHYLRWLKCSIFLAMISTAQAAEESCRYDLTLLDANADNVELSVNCTDPHLLRNLGFPYSGIEDYLTKTQDNNTQSYRIKLGAYADSINDANIALRRGRSLLISPDAILPSHNQITENRLFIHSDKGARHAAAYERDSDGGYIFRQGQLNQSGPFVLGQFASRSLPGENGALALLLEGTMKARPDQLFAWLEDLSKINNRFWGKPPVVNALVVLIPASREGLSGGRVLGGSGAVLLMNVGAQTEPSSLYGEWVGVHEFLHLGTPLTRDKGIWFNEGIATYFEPVVRYRAGWKSEDEIWQEWIKDMPRGVDSMSNIGLHPAGRRGAYWGGALFMLLSDIELRKASNGKAGMEDCLRVILKKIGGASQRGRMLQLLQLCDETLGYDVLQNLGNLHIEKGTTVNLEEIWERLGVKQREDGKISYNEAAPLAWVRKLIVEGNSTSFSGIPQTMPLN